MFLLFISDGKFVSFTGSISETFSAKKQKPTFIQVISFILFVVNTYAISDHIPNEDSVI